MKIGIYNIFVSFWFAFMLAICIPLVYIGIGRFDGEMNLFAKVAFSFFVLLALCIVYVMFRKFKIIIASENKIIAIFPGVGKRIVLNYTDITKLKWGYYMEKATCFKTLEIHGKNKINFVFSDYEFENFNAITGFIADKTGITPPNDIYILQAKTNGSFNIFVIVLATAFFLFITYQTTYHFNKVNAVSAVVLAILIYTGIKRKLAYDKWIK